MGLLKSFYFDEIAERDLTPDPDPRGPSPCPPVHVVMERNAITGEHTPIHVCMHLADANVIMLSRNAARYLTPDPESVDYYIKESVSCLG